MTAAILTEIKNVALGKPATQSSISKWSSANNVESDARVATNGDTVSEKFFHTNSELAPWWQVDLGGYFVIEEIRIFNRRELSERLLHFTVLVSLTGEPGSWLPLCRKDDPAEFGRGNDIPLVLTPDDRSLARFVRVRKDGAGFLHFRECEVLGYAPDADELASLHGQMEKATQRQTEQQAEIEQELAAGRSGDIVRLDGLIIFVDTVKYSPTLIRALTGGGYEGPERGILFDIVRPTDRVLEIGTAVGVVTMSLASIVGPANVMTYDANPAMVVDARRNFVANRMGEISAELGVMRNRGRWSPGERETDFFISRDFWASRLDAGLDSTDITRTVKVPLVCLERKIAEHRANVLVCDIEGGESDLLDGADLAPIRLIMLEIHYWAVGRRRIDDMIRFLISSGFDIDFTHTSHNIVVLDRMI